MDYSESYQEVLLDAEERMEKARENFKEQIRGLRTGRAQTSLVENIKVQYYGSPTPVRQLANIGIPEPSMIVVKPFDPTGLGEIEKAILKANIGVTPNNDGKIIRIIVPPLSEETRKQMVNRAKELAEEGKVSIRNIRRDANKKADGLEKSKDLSEDESAKLKDELQELTKKYEDEVAKILDQKTEELMTV